MNKQRTRDPIEKWIVVQEKRSFDYLRHWLRETQYHEFSEGHIDRRGAPLVFIMQKTEERKKTIAAIVFKDKAFEAEAMRLINDNKKT